MNPLRSGQSQHSAVPRRVNEQGRDGRFTGDQMIDTRHALEGRRQRMLIAGGAFNFVGEFDPNRAYSAFQWLVITSGDNAGSYVYVGATPSTGSGGSNPTIAPYIGAPQWVQVGSFGGNGRWG